MWWTGLGREPENRVGLLYKLISMDASGREFYDAGLRHWCGRGFWRRWPISTRARVDASSTMLAYGIDVDGSSVRFELFRSS